MGQEGRTQWRQWAACITATITMVCVGTVYGWLTTGLSRLMADDSPIPVTSDEGSWLVSLTTIGSMVGPFIGVASADTFGRKNTLLLASVIFIAGWAQAIFSPDVQNLYIARVVLGLGIGISYTTNPMYVSEVAEMNIRGAVGTLIAVNVFTGSVFSCSVGPFVTIKELSIISLIFPILFLVSFAWFPETPYFLASKEKYEEAAKSLMFFRGLATVEDARQELDAIVRFLFPIILILLFFIYFILAIVSIRIIDRNKDQQSWKGKLQEMTLQHNRKGLGIVVSLILTQLLSGNFSTMAYLEVLFSKANISINSDLATVIVLAMGLLFCALATVTVEKLGRRPLLLVSTLGSSVTLFILGTYLILNEHGVDLQAFNWLPIVIIILFQGSYQVGIGAIPDALIGELFPTNVKSIGSAAVTIFDGSFGFVVTKLYQVVGDAVGESVVYFFFAGSCLVAFVFVAIVIPETRNKTLSEIQMELADNRPRCWKRRVGSGVV